MRIVFLGTSGSYPTPLRNTSAIAIQKEGEVILFDCAEGTQRQFMRTPLSFMSVKNVFITHFHGDHFLGLPGMIQTMGLNGRKDPLDIYGPPGAERRLADFLGLNAYRQQFDVRCHDLVQGGKTTGTIEGDGWKVHAARNEHTIPCYSLAIEEPSRPGRFNKQGALDLGVPEGPLFGRLQRGEAVEVNGKTIRPEQVLGPARPGRKIAYSSDTKPCAPVIELARGADVLIHEATAAADLEAKANEYGHTTSRQAAEVAKAAGVRQLILTHISPRYEDWTPLLEEARAVFPNTELADDYKVFEVPLRDA